MPTVVVIGHGRSPEGKGWGSKIDECDLVFRMWDWTWQSAEDYGRKYDYGFYCATKHHVRSLQRYCQIFPKFGWIAEKVTDEQNKEPLAFFHNGGPTYLIENALEWRKIGVALGGRGSDGRFTQSRGTLTACWALENVVVGSTVVLVGFDNVRMQRALPLDQAFSPEYIQHNPDLGSVSFNDYPTQDGETTYLAHDFAIEDALIRVVAQNNGVIVKHAQEVWPWTDR